MESALTGESMNICSGVEVSQHRIVELVAQACNVELRIEARETAKTAMITSARRQVFSPDKARRLLEWVPAVPIDEGVARVLRWIDSLEER
jgi:nucleoside-diphosphate-sugar epimerase